ncbi:tyrosine-protein kinase Shark [Drosophila busckii]|uniref:tyrosine-protein kinase Shark n=1 Tax=Drosophila busckii TaxID=30019 RepID=UPI00083F28B0|nr:tyrosine-protein kinase Shark [Drosophila busckii]
MTRDEHMKWFHGRLTREAADDLLKQGTEDGTFLVRESSTAAGDFVLSLLCQLRMHVCVCVCDCLQFICCLQGEVCHYQIRRHGEDAFFSIDDKGQTKILHGLETLVDYYQQEPNGLITKLTTQLTGDPPPHNTRSQGVTNLLHRATSKNETKVVFELLKCGYRNFDAKNQDGQTALHLAALHCSEEILKLLLDARVQVNSADAFGYQPLHYACRQKPASFIRTLIDAQANVQGRNIENGHVPLHEAAKHGNLAAVQELLAAQAPLLPRTSSGEFPFDLAKEAGQTAVEEFLLDYKLPAANTSREHWYHGTLKRDEAIDVLKRFAHKLQQDQQAAGETVDNSGCFLVRYSESTATTGYVLTLLCDQQVKNFRISQADLYHNGKLKFLYIDDGPYLPSLEHLVAHFMRYSYGLPVSLKYAVPPQPKPEVPSFATIPRASHKSPTTPQTPVTPTTPLTPTSPQSMPTPSKKKQKESMFNTLRLPSPKKGLFDMNSLRKSKSKNKRSDSESSISGMAAAAAAARAEELQAAAPMLKNLSFSTDFSNFNVDADASNPSELYNVPRNNTPIQLPPIADKSAAEVEYFTKSDVAIERERAAALNANGYLPTVDVHMLLNQQLDVASKKVARIDSIISTGSTESEMANYLQRKCSGSATSSCAELEQAKQRFFIRAEQLELDTEIGSGEFGSVYRGWLRRPSAGEIRLEVAIKTLRDEEQHAINKQEFLREASVMMRLEHKCIVRLIGISKGDMLMMVQELAPLGSMLQYILDHSAEIKVNFELKLWASQIACGMHYLESQHFVHRDLAARNILLTSRQQAKISDFGMSRSLGAGSAEYQVTQGGRWPIRWYAPESFNNGIFSHASDVWSFGVTLWEMFALGAPPYGDVLNKDAIKLVDDGYRLPQPDLCPVYIYAVMQSCWQLHPKERPTFAYLMEFFSRDPDYQNLQELVHSVHI